MILKIGTCMSYYIQKLTSLRFEAEHRVVHRVDSIVISLDLEQVARRRIGGFDEQHRLCLNHCHSICKALAFSSSLGPQRYAIFLDAILHSNIHAPSVLDQCAYLPRNCWCAWKCQKKNRCQNIIFCSSILIFNDFIIISLSYCYCYWAEDH